MLQGIGAPELLIVLAIVAILFGVGRVGKLGKEMGTAIHEFRKGLNESEEKSKDQEKE